MKVEFKNMIDTTLQEQKLLGQGQGIPSVDAYIRANPATGSNIPINTDTNSIKAENIGNVKPLNFSPQNAGTASNALIGSTDATLETAINQQKTSAEQATAQSKQSMQDTLNQYLGVQSSRGEVEAGLNIPELGKLSNETFSSLQASKRAQERELKAITEQPGVTKEQAQSFAQEINRKYAFEQADLAIAYDVANRNLSSAQATADRKIQLQLEPLKTLLDFQTTFYQDNKADLSKAQQNQLQNLITKNTREYETTQTDLKYLRDVKMKYLEGVVDGTISPNAVNAIQGAQTPEDVINVASRYAVGKAGTTGGTLIDAIIENPSLFNQLTPTDKAKVVPQLYAKGFTQFGKPLSDTAIKEITQSESALLGLNDLKTKIQGNEQYLGPIRGLQRFNPYSQAREIQSDVDRIRQQVGKALEGGVLRKEDEEKYKKILATLADVPETALYKIDALISSIGRDVETYKNNQLLSGRNVPVGEVKAPDLESLRSKYNY